MSVQVDVITQTIEVQIVDDEVVSVSILDGVSVLTDGTLAGVARAIEFLSGSNVTISAVKVDNKVRVTINSTASSSGSGDVTGPSSSTDGNAVGFNGATGKIIKDLGAAPVLVTRTINGQALSSNMLIPLINSNFYSGNYYSNYENIVSTTTRQMTANTLKAYAWFIKKGVSFNEIVAEVTGNVASTTFRIAIYSDNGSLYPNELIANSDSGTFDSASTGHKTNVPAGNIVIPSSGYYWIAFNSNGAPTLRAFGIAGSASALGGGNTIGASTGHFNVGYTVSEAYGAMPSTFPVGATQDSNVNSFAAIFKVV